MKCGNELEQGESNWVFDENVAPEFDNHVSRSVPDYDHVQDMAVEFAGWWLYNEATVLDLGAATGTTMDAISKQYGYTKPRVMGYDNSMAMIEQAKAKGINGIEFRDLETKGEFPNFAYGLALYTLQFLRLEARRDVMLGLYDAMDDDGAIFVVEKVLATTGRFQDIAMQSYWQMKMNNGYKADEVWGKASAIRSVLRPLTIEENEEMFRNSGFMQTELVYRRGMFCGWLCMK